MGVLFAVLVQHCNNWPLNKEYVNKNNKPFTGESQEVWVTDQVWGQDGWILAKFFFCVFMDRDEVKVHKLAKKGMRPISSHLDRTNLVNKGFIIWLLGKFYLWDTAGSHEQARWLHLACSDSQSQRMIWFILPARGAGQIINRDITQYRR